MTGALPGPDDMDLAIQDGVLFLKIIRTCNNHCMFCCDRPLQDGYLAPRERVLRKIVAGWQSGIRRLFLTGGEPTLHPHLLDFIRAARGLGFQPITLITNGRMFSYPEFARKALEAGLTEVIWSIHGHTAILHDGLVGYRGAFDQVLHALHNVREHGGCRVVISSIVNGNNIRALAAMTEAFCSWGAQALNYIWVTPTGWVRPSTPSRLFVMPAGAESQVDAACAFAARASVPIEISRFPAHFYEGHENLFTYPDNLAHEVRDIDTRRKIFSGFLREGRERPCKGAACDACFLGGFCRHLETMKENGHSHHHETCSLRRIERPEQAGISPEKSREPVEVVINRDVVEWLSSLSTSRLQELAARSVFSLGTYETLEEQRSLGARPPENLMRLRGVRTRGIPLCWVPLAEPANSQASGAPERGVDADPEAIARRFLRDHAYAKGRACGECRRRKSCPGLHVHAARHFGFSSLRPPEVSVG